MISIVITAYNNDEFIHECLDSVISSCKNLEYEILLGIDNCEKTYKSVLNQKKKYQNLKLFFFKKKPGTYIIRNTLFKECQYKKIIFFDSDDLMSKNLVSKTNELLDNFDFVKFSFFNFKENEELKLINETSSNNYAAGAFGINKHVFKFLNGFEPWVCAADNEFFWRVESNKFKIRYLSEAPFFYRRYNQSLSNASNTNMNSTIRKKYHEIRSSKRKTSNYGPLPDLVISDFQKRIDVPNKVKSNLIIVSTIWNAKNFVRTYVNSIKRQQYKNFKVFVIDDNSNDGTYETLLEEISDDTRFTIFKNTTQKFKTQNFYELINNNELIDDEDVIIELDGDDYFFGNDVLNKVDYHFSNLDLWIAGYNWIDNFRRKSPFTAIPDADNPRKNIWGFSAMRVFKAFLFRNIKKTDLMFEGEFIKAANDIAYGMPMLEMAGKEHFKKFNDITYVYNWHNRNTHTINSSVKDTTLQKRTEKYIYSLPRYNKLKFKLTKTEKEHIEIQSKNLKENRNLKLDTINKKINKNYIVIKQKKNNLVEKTNDLKNINLTEVKNKVEEETSTIKEILSENIIVNNTDTINNKEKNNLISKLVTNVDLKKFNPVIIENNEKYKVNDNKKILEYINNKENLKIIKSIVDSPKIVKPQNKTDIDNRRKEWQEIFLKKS
jgi:glycosyltransferase involved in cell wall biosynthesis